LEEVPSSHQSCMYRSYPWQDCFWEDFCWRMILTPSGKSWVSWLGVTLVNPHPQPWWRPGNSSPQAPSVWFPLAPLSVVPLASFSSQGKCGLPRTQFLSFLAKKDPLTLTP
jgi:hypothetical protein